MRNGAILVAKIKGTSCMLWEPKDRDLKRWGTSPSTYSSDFTQVGFWFKNHYKKTIPILLFISVLSHYVNREITSVSSSLISLEFRSPKVYTHPCLLILTLNVVVLQGRNVYKNVDYNQKPMGSNNPWVLFLSSFRDSDNEIPHKVKTPKSLTMAFYITKHVRREYIFGVQRDWRRG